ncbi:MAG: SIS domain-containing protein [Kiritimatiellae bacterium]|nr:SIS domain-containing protein [Kiritimatiellia bacterium]
MKDALKSYAEALAEALAASDWAALERIGAVLLDAKQQGRTVYLFGNGGSSATASHVTNDLLKGCRVDGRVGFKAFCLSDSSTLMTCLANDFAYEDVYSILLQTYAQPGDVAIAFSGSGNSPNVVKGLMTAREMGLVTVGLGGRDGGRMKSYCDHLLIAPTQSMEMLEDLHLIYFHNLVCAMRVRLGGGSCGC